MNLFSKFFSMKNRIWLSLAHMGGREQEFIQEAFDTNWVVPLGPNVNAFEKALRDFLIENGKLKVEDEGKQVVALSAGTAALHLGTRLFARVSRFRHRRTRLLI